MILQQLVRRSFRDLQALSFFLVLPMLYTHGQVICLHVEESGPQFF